MRKSDLLAAPCRNKLRTPPPSVVYHQTYSQIPLMLRKQFLLAEGMLTWQLTTSSIPQAPTSLHNPADKYIIPVDEGSLDPDTTWWLSIIVKPQQKPSDKVRKKETKKQYSTKPHEAFLSPSQRVVIMRGVREPLWWWWWCLRGVRAVLHFILAMWLEYTSG